jgi:hypothetical protein
MAQIKYPEQWGRLKKMRKLANTTALQAAELVHTDLRNWQRWESGENLVPESAIELFCIKSHLDYKDFATQKSQTQIDRDKKRKEKFLEYRAKIAGSAAAHNLDDGAFEKINEVEAERKKLRDKISKKNKI